MLSLVPLPLHVLKPVTPSGRNNLKPLRPVETKHFLLGTPNLTHLILIHLQGLQEATKIRIEGYVYVSNGYVLKRYTY